MDSLDFSVVMPFYHGDDPYALDMALESLYKQTLKANEIVLVQDGPVSQELCEVASKWKSKYPYINHVVLPENQGLANALNSGIKQTKFRWIARFDADDYSLPHRFEVQVGYLKANPEVDIIGSNVVEFDELLETRLGRRDVPETHSSIVKFGKWRCPFNHTTVMFRKSIVENIGYYKNYGAVGDDYELWARLLINGYKAYNIQEALVHNRTGREMLTKRRRGINYLKSEVSFLSDLRRMGFLTNFQFLFNIILKSTLRVIPISLLKAAYSATRKK